MFFLTLFCNAPVVLSYRNRYLHTDSIGGAAGLNTGSPRAASRLRSGMTACGRPPPEPPALHSLLHRSRYQEKAHRNGGPFPGAGSGTRTRTGVNPRDFKSLVSTDSTMPACFYYYITNRAGKIVFWLRGNRNALKQETPRRSMGSSGPVSVPKTLRLLSG